MNDALLTDDQRQFRDAVHVFVEREITPHATRWDLAETYPLELFPQLGKLGWLAAFIYAAGAGLRLARFNVQTGAADKRYFRGLPSPAAAAMVMGFIWVLHASGIPGREISILALAVTVLAGVLMVSNIRYRSFKDLDLRGRVPFVTILIVPLVFVLVFLDPPQVLFLVSLAYTLSGPVAAALRLVHRVEDKPAEKHGL